MTETKALENLRAAEDNLRHVRETAPNEQARAIALLGVHPGDGHPYEMLADERIAEATIAVSQARGEYSRVARDVCDLRDGYRAAIDAAIKRLEQICDPSEPTLASTPEAAEEYQRDCEAHGHALEHNAAERARIEGVGLERARKASSIAAAKAELQRAEQEIEGIVDPSAPALGAPTRSNIAALERALASHREVLATNRQLRLDVERDFRTVLHALLEAQAKVGARRKAEGLPALRIFAAGTYVDGRSAFLGMRDCRFDAETLAAYRDALGAGEPEERQAKDKLRQIALRTRVYEAREAARKAGKAYATVDGKSYPVMSMTSIRGERRVAGL